MTTITPVRAIVAALVVLVVLIVVWPSSPKVQPAVRSASPTTTAPASTTTTSHTWTTSTTQLDLVDTTRPLVAGGDTLAPGRALPTTIVSPVGRGRFPLVVFVHGYEVGLSFYDRYLQALAAHGYVVAAPSFPLEDPSRGYPLTEADIPNEARDVAFVIHSLSEGSWRSRLAPGAVAVVGHSDGADVALLAGYGAASSDPAIRAVIADAPDAMTVPTLHGGPPLELVHGSADQIVSPTSSASVMTQVEAERWSVTLTGADHASPIKGPSPWTASFDAATLSFLDAVVGGHGTAQLTAMLAALPGVSVVAAAGP